MEMVLVKEKKRCDDRYDQCQTQKLKEGKRVVNVGTDVIRVFTLALLALQELQESRRQINKIVEKIIKEEEATRRSAVAYAGTKVAKKVEPEPAEVFIYGQDAQRIQAVVNDSIVGKIKTTRCMAAITIHNHKMTTSQEIRTYLQYEWRKLGDITSIVVILQDVTEKNLVKFRESGFVSFCKERKTRVHVICWSSLRPGGSFHPSLLRSFGKLVFIPSSPEEQPWLQKVEVKATIKAEAELQRSPPSPPSPKRVRNETEPGPSQSRRPIDTKLLNALMQPPRLTFGRLNETKKEIGWVVPPPPRPDEAEEAKPPLPPKPQRVNDIKTGSGSGPVLSPTTRPMAPGHHEGSRSFASVAFAAMPSEPVVEIADVRMDKRGQGNDDTEECPYLCCLGCIFTVFCCGCG